MEIDDNDFLVIRKNLNIISVLILILAYTNAQLHSLNFLGIEMDLDGIKLYKALFIGYIYFLWRFLTKLPLRGGFWTDFLQYYLNGEEGVRKKYNYERYKESFIEKSARLKKAIEENDKHLYLNQLSVNRFQGWPLSKLRLSANFNSTGDGTSGSIPNFTVDHDIQVSRVFLLGRFILFCVKYDKFGDYLFPLVPVLANIGFFFFKFDWQGSFFSLFLLEN